MAEPVGDLVVDLSLDAARFDEQMARVRRHFSGTESDAKKTAAVVEQSLSRQALAAQKAGISVGQYKAAMRMLPAQFTDVATQLAGGQSPWLILLQQGGQVKDSFGGMIPMFRGLAGAITLPMVGATSLAVATGALAYAWYQGNSTLSDFNKTLVLSGNQAGLTADRMLVLSRAGQAAGLTFNQTSESLSALVKAGVSGEAQIASISQSVARFSSASGVEVDKVAEAFGKLTTDPTSGLTAMARQFHNVTTEQIAYVAQLQRSGDEAGALQAANEAATKGFDDQTRRLKENMGTLETWADRTARAFKSMWDAVLDIGRPDTAQEMLIKAEAAFKKADDIWNLRKDDYFVNDEARARYWDDREKARLALEAARKKAEQQTQQDKNAQQQSDTEASRLKYTEEAQKAYERLQTPLEKYTARQEELNKALPDGFGGTEPRITCNAYLTTQRKAWDVLSDFCSAMRCMPVWNGQTLTFVQDRPSDKVWTYNRSNVVMPDDGAPFRYSFSALKDRHNAVEVNWIDPNNGWETATELVEDTQAIARYGRNVTKMDAFGCTSRGQAHRAGLWLIKTELLETQTVDFSVGAEGLRHVPGDVIEICDDDYAGISIGGRVLAVNSQTRTLTLDREITLPSSGTTLISLVDGQGNPVSVEVQSVTDGVKVKVSRVPDGVAEYSVWGLKLPTLRQRLFRCVSIRENDDGTYAITAVQHVPEKEAIVDNGAHFDGDQSGTVNGVTPPAVQHLTAEVTADSGEYQVLARWDTPKVVKGVSFMLRLTVAADDGSERLVSTARTTETTYRFTQLAPGNYRLTVRAANAWGQQGDPASVSFRIAAPAAPSRIELTPGYFQITATPHLAVYDPTVQFEFWFSEKRITDIRQVETTARYLGTGLYWIAASINIKPGHDYYFYIRSVNTVGKSAFVEAVGRASDDAEGYLDFFKGKITESHLGKELLEKVDLTEDNASRLDEFSKEWKDANDKWNAMWGVKIEQTKDGKHYVAGIGLSMEDTEEGKLSQFLVAANRIAFIDPANGNETPMFVAQGNQIFMNDVFLKRLTAPTITSGGSPPVFSLTSDGKLTAKNADISGSVNANSGTLNNVTINENCQIKGKLSANQIEGDIVKTVSKSFPRTSTYASGTITVRISDDQKFDRQVMIPPVLFRGGKHENFNSNNQQSYWYSTCRLRVTRNGQEIFNQSTTDAQGVFSSVIDMPAGQGTLTLTFTVSSSGANNWTPTTSISDLLVVVMKKSTAGISIS
ncbi:phage tail tip domain-containing protein [Escherichia coli]|nr:phage tail length tape measure family protein [Escherichia coli]